MGGLENFKNTKNAVFAKIKSVRLSPRRQHGNGTFPIVWWRVSALMKFGGHVLDQSVSHCGDPWTVLEQNSSLDVSLDVTDVAIRTALTCHALLAIFSTQSEKKIRKYPIISDF